MDINMSITSFYFLCFYVLLLLIYYIVPKKLQWAVLLAGGFAYCLLSGQGILILYPVVTGGICYIAGKVIEKAKEGEKAEAKKRRLGLLFALAGTLCLLIVVKYSNFFIDIVNSITGLFCGGQIEALDILIPLGISYYTFMMLGYVIDIYYGIGKSAPSFGRFLLFGTYFPALISGPIMSYQEMGEQFAAFHKFDYKQVTFGMQRMLWGFFKKLVISERMALVANTIFNDYENYGGFYFWVAAIFFVLQLYTDFSGCMDIVLGLSETFGLKLPENFQTPFFSRSISEFWRRWHITLGTWMKNYVFYPLLRSKLFTDLGKKTKKRFGRKAGKQITTFAAMFVLWFTVGIWHGPDFKFVLGSGLIHWFYIVLGEICEPLNKKVRTVLHIRQDGRGFGVFQRIRTFFLVTLAFLFFRADSVGTAVYMLKSMFSTWNPGVIFGGTFFTMGLDWVEMTIAMVSLVILLVISLLQEKGIHIRESISQKKLPIRWNIWYALLFYTILLGYYGPGYSAAEFIYQGF